ncbi:MAG: hypothetical protein EA361_14300 [Bacteroidetes bacterium]|nr:MAG: hypothetical protein EA361_14300 [Bacteroidota bacterium]
MNPFTNGIINSIILLFTNNLKNMKLHGKFGAQYPMVVMKSPHTLPYKKELFTSFNIGFVMNNLPSAIWHQNIFSFVNTMNYDLLITHFYYFCPLD